MIDIIKYWELGMYVKHVSVLHFIGFQNCITTFLHAVKVPPTNETLKKGTLGNN